MKNKMSCIEKRSIICLFMVMVMFFVASFRIMTVMTKENYSAAATRQNTYRLTVTRQRGTIFDANMKSLTNGEKKTYTAVMPTDEGKNTMSKYLSLSEMKELSKKLSSGKPVLIETEGEVKGEGTESITVSVNDKRSTLAVHLLGYVDSSGHGMSGLQKAFDGILYSDSTVDFLYARDARGNILSRFETKTSSNESIESSGIKTTIDMDIQKLTEEAAAELVSGAVVVSEVGTGKIRAIVSKPTFDPSNISQYLNDGTSPLINRAFCAYNVGSVFKPCVAAAALEQDVYSTLMYECTGSKEIATKSFACHKSSGHGLIGLNDALAFSCNTFFYTIGQKIGATAVYDMYSSLMFGQEHIFCKGLSTEKGNMPKLNEIEASEQALANTVIGQGSVMLTPVSLLTLYEAIANGGEYHKPMLIEGVVKNGVVSEEKQSEAVRVMSRKTAATIKEALCDVVAKGTGQAARPKSCTAAGKTATAQTGWIINEKSVNHSWFCGFFPADDPQYVAVIISENTNGGGTACPPIFSRLADAVYTLKLS